MRIALFLLALTASAQAKDMMIIFNEQEQQMLRQVLDRATRADGLQIAPATVYLLNKLNSGMEVIDRKDDDVKDQDKQK